MELHEEDFKRLSGLDEDNNARISETDFTKRLLPHLIPHEGQGTRDMDIYLAVAGNPYRMIDVMDTHDKNKVLFTVPPLLSQTPASIRSLSADPRTDIGELAAHFEAEIGTSHPGAVIDNFVNKMTALTIAPADAMEIVYAKMWAMIYKRYSIPLERLYGEHAPAIQRLLGEMGVPDSTDPAATRKQFDEIDEDDLDPI